MREIEWAMWANEQALISAFLALIGGIIGVASAFHYWQCAAASIVVSVIVLIIEYPRGSRAKGHTMERRFQEYLSPLAAAMAPVTGNYYVRGFSLLVFGVPCCFLLPTIMGGLSLMLGGLIYFVAAIKGERWKPIPKRGSSGANTRTIVASEPPSRPAPRLVTTDRVQGSSNLAYEQDQY